MTTQTKHTQLKTVRVLVENEADQWHVMDKSYKGTVFAICENEEMATLFSSAPELLQALKEVMTDGGALAHKNHSLSIKRLKSINVIAKTAIARAEGRTI